MFTGINIYPINNQTDHISGNFFFLEKKVKRFSILGRIRIHIKIKRIRNTACQDGISRIKCQVGMVQFDPKTANLLGFRYSVMQSYGNSFGGDVVMDSFDIACRDKDSINDQ